jgi:hypothetical protein
MVLSCTFYCSIRARSCCRRHRWIPAAGYHHQIEPGTAVAVLVDEFEPFGRHRAGFEFSSVFRAESGSAPWTQATASDY